ncbi:MAG: hypothetical protein EXR84_14030 [Gammaproteobacteria bacterium]|nr:hypothetical protein [Gammaproteobacteria bacterium]
MAHEIEVEDLVLQVEITMLIDTPADHTSWDSPEDYNGCKELEFAVLAGEQYDEDGKATELDRNGLANAAETHAEAIEAQLWDFIELRKERAQMERGDE